MLIRNEEIDLKWFTEDRDSYEAEIRRIEAEYNRQLTEFMGEDFSIEPLLTKRELHQEIELRKERIEKFKSLKADEAVLKYEQEQLEQSIAIFSCDKYILTEEDAKYRFAYDAKAQQFIEDITVDVPDWIKALAYIEESKSERPSAPPVENAVVIGPDNTPVDAELWETYLLDLPDAIHYIAYRRNN
jgi:hypothetical protein